ncbi:HAD family hydrolase [Pareuzebyella sediminis]|uniref:HAD family hydrolase n=1 Tax=Pareuzebyella sediminis TaxID=2607998 RepID=UPI0011ED5B81|nr:HAD family hydrolase [Pareuzebyella sediminis]
MKYKILCSDLDGTLLSTKSDVSEYTISQLARVKNETRIILVSARMPRAMVYLQRRLGITDQPLVCYNGALVVEGDTVRSSTEIKLSILEEIHRMASDNFTKLGLYFSDEWYVEENTERVRKEIKYTQSTPHFRETEKTFADWKDRGIGAHKIMLMGTKNTADTLFPVLKQHFDADLTLYRSNDTLIEVAPKSVSKLSGIQELLRKDESLDDVIAFGDNYNDLDMLANCGYGVAVGNAREEVKAIADAITLPHYEDGVARFIEQHLVI